jgi:uncharacterized membrane protein YfcA
MFALSVLFLVALAAGALGGLVGTGSSLVLLPILVTMYGPRIAVPIMGIAAVMANVGRVAAWWRQICWRPVLAYALPGAPAAVIGAHTLLTISQTLSTACSVRSSWPWCRCAGSWRPGSGGCDCGS